MLRHLIRVVLPDGSPGFLGRSLCTDEVVWVAFRNVGTRILGNGKRVLIVKPNVGLTPEEAVHGLCGHEGWGLWDRRP